MHNDLTIRILSNVWAINPMHALAYRAKALSIFKGESVSMSDAKEIRQDLKQRTETLFLVEANAGGFSTVAVDAVESIPKGAIAVMRVNGVIQKESDMCNKGLDAYENELDAYGTNGNVKGVIIEVNSPGGTAMGGDVFAQQLADFEGKYQKPVAVIIKSMAASAAYGMIAQAPKIFVSSPSAEAGSIGTMATFYDDKEWLQANGIQEIVVRATKSFNKNEPFYQALQGNTEPLKTEILDPLNEAFIAQVKKGRRGKIDLKNTVKNGNITVPEALSGRVYFGQDIINAGLADEMGNRDEAMKYIENRAKELKQKNTKQTVKQQMFDLKNKSVDELNAIQTELTAKIEADAENLELQQELEIVQHHIEFQNLKASVLELSQKNAEIAQANEALEKITAELADSNAKIDALLNEKADLVAEIAGFEAEKEKAVELNAELEATQNELKQTKVQLEAWTNFVNAKFPKDAEKIVQLHSQSTEQPEVKEKAVTKSKEEDLQDWVKVTRQIGKNTQK